MLQYLYCILRSSDHQFHFTAGVEGQFLKCLFDTANTVSSSQGVDEHKFKLTNYNGFFTGATQDDASEGLMLSINITNKGFVPCSIDNYVSGRELLF